MTICNTTHSVKRKMIEKRERQDLTIQYDRKT